MRRRVYLETTIVSYLTARPMRTVVGAARQQSTLDWWEGRRHEFDLVVSEAVIREAERGDPDAAKRRLAALRGIPRLALTREALLLAEEFVGRGLLPSKAAEDGLHIAVATVHKVDYLLTWKLAEYLVEREFFLPFICTPEELLGAEQ